MSSSLDSLLLRCFWRSSAKQSHVHHIYLDRRELRGTAGLKMKGPVGQHCELRALEISPGTTWRRRGRPALARTTDPIFCTSVGSASGRGAKGRWGGRSKRRKRTKTHVDLSEEKLLKLVVHGKDSSTGNTTQDVGAGALEKRGNSLGLDDLATS